MQTNVDTDADTAILPTLDARVRFPLPPDPPWDTLRTVVWRVQKISDPMAAHRLALAYEEEVYFEERLHAVSPLRGEVEQAWLMRRLRLTAEAYRARVGELCRSWTVPST